MAKTKRPAHRTKREREREPKPSAAARSEVEHRIAAVGRDLSRSFAAVLQAVPGAPHRPQFLARSLGVNTVLTSRLLKAAKQRDPIAVAHFMPGPEPLRRLLKAAERKKVDINLIRAARQAVDQFQHLIDAVAGDRSALDAIISGWLPDARTQTELLAKQSVFRGMSQLLGISCEVSHHAVIVWPSDQKSDRADSVWLTITRGLRRVRPGLVAKYDTIHTTQPMLTIHGRPVEDVHSLMLEQFCSKPLPEIDVMRFHDRLQITMRGEDVGIRSAVDLAEAVLVPGVKPLYREPGDAGGGGPRKVTFGSGVSTPLRTLLFDVLLHEDVYPNQHPSLYIYRTEPGNIVDPNDRRGDVDLINVIESVQPLTGTGGTTAGGTTLRVVQPNANPPAAQLHPQDAKRRAAAEKIAAWGAGDESPRYLEALEYICQVRNYDPAKLRAYRCRIEYPIYSSQVVLAFELPEGP